MKVRTNRRPRATNVMYVAAIIVALIALGLLINNILLFRNTIAQYVAQGYPYADVFWGLFPSQLLPGVAQPLALYGGMAALLYAACAINHKVAAGLELLAEPKAVENNDDISQPEVDQSEDQ